MSTNDPQKFEPYPDVDDDEDDDNDEEDEDDFNKENMHVRKDSFPDYDSKSDAIFIISPKTGK